MTAMEGEVAVEQEHLRYLIPALVACDLEEPQLIVAIRSCQKEWIVGQLAAHDDNFPTLHHQ